MKKKLSYRDKLVELAYIYDVKEIKDYEKSRKNLTSGQLELILKKNRSLNFKILSSHWPWLVLLKFYSTKSSSLA